MPEATEVSAQISEPMPEFQVAGIQLALQKQRGLWKGIVTQEMSEMHIGVANHLSQGGYC